MSINKSFIRLSHRVDLYSRVTTKNDMGQNKASWNLETSSQVCSYVPSGSSTAIRVSPTVEEADYYTIFFPHDADINYSTRFKNLRTIVGDNIIDSRYMQVIQIDKNVSLSGQIQHIQVKVKTVIEP